MGNLKDSLKDHEGFSAKPYRDANGWSLGFGHFIGTGSCEISPQVADLILDEDIHQAQFHYLSLGWDISQAREDVCIHMIFWFGFKGFCRFKKMARAIEQEDWGKAADEMMDSQAGRNYAPRMSELAEVMRHGGVL